MKINQIKQQNGHFADEHFLDVLCINCKSVKIDQIKQKMALHTIEGCHQTNFAS
jgi:predicted negative regulator of RcsB-dependent stress response